MTSPFEKPPERPATVLDRRFADFLRRAERLGFDQGRHDAKIALGIPQPMAPAVYVQAVEAVANETLGSQRLGLADAKRRLAELEKEAAQFQRGAAELKSWASQPAILQKPSRSFGAEATEAIRSGEAIGLKEIIKRYYADGRFSEIFAILRTVEPVAFVVEHDWSGAFENADVLDGDEVRPPYDQTLFEFRISGRPACLLHHQQLGALYLLRVSCGWAAIGCSPDMTTIDADDLNACTMMQRQARAVCIALDAEVAIAEVVRAPDRLNRAREKRGATPLNDYHVVRLNRRPRAAPLDRDPFGEPSHRKRMHFVRGHWRHFEAHKTWIKWHLRGDPDLGFIDKHYRL